MPFPCVQFLDVAKTLVADGADDQARLRAAAGRAYYAVYGVVRSGIAERAGGWPLSSRSGHHDEIRKTLVEAQGTDLKELGEHLKHLYTLRVRADYDYHNSIGRREVIEAIEVGKKAADIAANLSKAQCGYIRGRLPR